MTYDANTMLAHVENQRNQIETEVNKTVFPEVQYAQLIPVDTSAPEWTKTVTFYSSEAHGQADWINANADDMPMAGNSYSKKQESIQMAGIGYGYGYEELVASMQNGVDLPSEDAIAARETYEQFVDNLAFFGDESKGMSGLINNSSVTTNASAKTFLSSTEREILSEINALIMGTATATGYQMPADTILLPYEQYTYLASTPLGDNRNGTLLSFVLEYNVYTAKTGQQLTIRGLPKLKGTGAGNTDRAVAYTRNPRVLKMHIPMPHKFLPTFQSGVMNFVVGGIFRVSGTEIRNTDAVRYLEGI